MKYTLDPAPYKPKGPAPEKSMQGSGPATLRDRKVKSRQDTSLNVPTHEVIAQAKANSLSVQRVVGYGKILDARLLAIEGRICQIIRTRQITHSRYPKAVHAALYLPRTEFADFLIYVAFPLTGDPRFYVVPRGVMTKDTAWSLESLEQYCDAWQVFKQPITPDLTERRFTILNWQLQAIMNAAKDVNLEVTLMGLRKRRRWPLFFQRRVVVGGRKCAVYCCSRLTTDPTLSHYNYVFLRTPTKNWAEFQLCIVKDGPNECEIYVVPRGAIRKETTASLDHPEFQYYKSNWNLLSMSVTELEKITPIEWRRKRIQPANEFSMTELEKIAQTEARPKLTRTANEFLEISRPKKALPEALMKTGIEAQSHGLSVELVTRHESGRYLRNKCLFVSQKLCQVVRATLVTGAGRYTGGYVASSEIETDCVEFVVFFVTSEIEGGAATFYIVPRAKLIEDTVLLPAWIQDYKDAWNLLL